MIRGSRIAAYTVIAGFVGVALAGLFACNEHPVSIHQGDGVIERTEYHDPGGGQELDLLWMIDNSGSMCRSQEILRDSIDDFVRILTDVNLDFHIAVTTSHMLHDDSFQGAEAINALEPVARPGHIQSTPQPIPGFEAGGLCYYDIYTPNDPEVEDGLIEPGEVNIENLTAFDSSVEAAVECTEDPSEWQHLLDYDEQEVRCANVLSAASECEEDLHPDDADFCVCPDDPHPFTECFECPDDDEKADVEDFFPDPDAYRDVPLVLRSEDYILEDGSFDTDEFRRDFSCMSFVGTRGWGIERGLDAVTAAVSPELAGTTPYEEIEDLEAARQDHPNAGFLRRDADTGLVFISDENDCSHGGDVCQDDCEPGQLPLSQCNVHQCTIEENLDADRPEDERVLLGVDTLADQLLDNLALSKGVVDEDELEELDEDEDPIARDRVLPASIHAPYQRDFDSPNSCPEGGDYEVPISCRTEMGRGWSGHRYEFFLRQFDDFFPRPQDGNDIDTSLPLTEASQDPDHIALAGEVCTEFSGVIEDIAGFFQAEAASCIDRVAPCTDDSDCRPHPHTDQEGECVTYPAFDESDDDAPRYCDTGVEVRLRTSDEDQTRQDVLDSEYCIEDTFDEPGFEDSCVVDPSYYRWSRCEDREDALLLTWSQPDWELDIGHLEIVLRYVVGDPVEDDDQQDDQQDDS